MKERTFYGKKIRLITGNIALVDADAIVNAANKSLILGGGVAGAIRNLGGPAIQQECNRIGPVEAGEAVLTNGGNLKARFVIHAVGPVYGEGDEEDKLSRATLNSLKLAAKHQLSNIVFPAVSTGIFRFPIQKCSRIMLSTAIDFLEKNTCPEQIIFCLYDDRALSVFEKTLEELT